MDANAAPSLGDRLAALKADRARLLREKADKSKEIKTTQKRFKRLKKAAAKLSQEDLLELLRVKEAQVRQAAPKAKAAAAPPL